ncbi:MAG: XdhC/CoxI family protein [Candidatus Promineifilaceae bacterium]|nr:XdhC/CoxI family protein [Candidatus Promineifilaceae bacterium]
MREVLGDIDRWRQQDTPVALATVIETWGSAPRQAGAKMAMTADGQISGSVSGGCVEGAVYDAALEVLTGGPSRLLHFGVADETAWDVGLACGGELTVFVERLDPAVYTFMHGLLDRDVPFAEATVVGGPGSMLGRKLLIQRGGRLFGHIDVRLDAAVGASARATLSRPSANGKIFEADVDDDPVRVFIQPHQPQPTLVMVGGVHIAVALDRIAQTLGYRTVVIDPRRAFGNETRFPEVTALIQAWPEEALEEIQITPATAVALLTHDPKIDDPALRFVLSSSAFYVGALGSERTHAARRQRLREAGIPNAQIARIRAPIGLDIGAQTPEEIALAIMAEVVATRRGQPD